MRKSLVSRRALFAISAAAIVQQKLGAAHAQDVDEISDRLVAEILFEESEGQQQLLPRTLIKPFWFEQPAGTRPSPNWPPDNVSFDYAHLVSQPNSDSEFAVTPTVLEQLMALSSFDTQATKLLFGFRGCTLAASADFTDWGANHLVHATRPNHIDPKCLIGVWDKANNAIALFKASTVPNVDLMEKHIEGALGCNMMPTGFHHYRVGAHRAPRQPGAFIQRTPLWVMRTKKNLYYATNDANIVWDDLNGDLPFDNLHAAMLSSRKTPPYFSSAGCQVVAGAYDDQRRPTGAWAKFRQAAGLAHPLAISQGSVTSDDGKPFDYALLTGKDTQLVAAGTTAPVRALRYGSSGQRVADLQQKLNVTPDAAGAFDRKTLGAVIRWQVEKKFAPTGIIAAAAASELGLNWS